MKLSVTQTRNLRNALLIMGFGITVAMIYPVFADSWSNKVAFINAFSIGLIGSIIVVILELEVFDPHKKRRSFLFTFFVKTTLYFLFFALLVPLIMAFNESIYYNKGFIEHFKSDQFQHFIFHEDYKIILFYSFVFICIINFTRQMNRKLGQGVLLNYITGKYHSPKEVERIFMFLDIRSSTSIAEQLGELDFHYLIRDFFQDITSSILLSKGHIYRYVGDQVVVSWKMTDGLQHAHCIKAYFYIKEKIKSLREKYLLRFGLVPKFSASLHSGKVIIGEIGELKSQIVYHGEMLYQLAAIEKFHGKLELDENILISDPLIRQLSISSLYKLKEVGALPLDDGSSMSLYSLSIGSDIEI